MFRHMLVPLDGSRLAEAVLPVTAAFARALGAKVTLLHVVEPAAPTTVHGDVHLTQAEEAVARGTPPVLLMAPTAVRREQVWTVRRLLVSLDGSEMAEAALLAATALAHGFAAEILLVMVVPTVATLTDDRAGAARRCGRGAWPRGLWRTPRARYC